MKGSLTRGYRTAPEGDAYHAAMVEAWHWDETLFAGAAPYYARGRLPYAPGLAAAFADSLGLDGSGDLLDVGCGPGSVTLPVAHLFTRVIGLDPDAGMLAEARRLALERGVRNAAWVKARAEELPPGLGPFRVVTFAASFHWMERELVAAAVRQVLQPGGVLVHVDNHHQDGTAAPDGPHPPPPEGAISELRSRYLGPKRRAGQSVRESSPGDEDAVFAAAGFVGPERVGVADGRVLARSVDDLVAATFSNSASAPHLFGESLARFEADLRELLARSSPSGLFSVRLPENELKIWRPRP